MSKLTEIAKVCGDNRTYRKSVGRRECIYCGVRCHPKCDDYKKNSGRRGAQKRRTKNHRRTA